MTITLNEHKSSSYGPRTWYNAKRADLTAAFAFDFSTFGEQLTAKAAGDAYVDISLSLPVVVAARRFYAALKRHNVKVLNVAGNGIYTCIRRGMAQRQLDNYLAQVFDLVLQHYKLDLIVSGGQTGADFSAAVMARYFSIDADLMFPKGFKQRNVDKVDFTNTQEELLKLIDTNASHVQNDVGYLLKTGMWAEHVKRMAPVSS